MKSSLIIISAFLLIFSAQNTFAQLKEPNKLASQKEEIKQKLTELFPRLGDVEISESPIAGVFQFWTGATLNHVRFQDDHLLLGTLYDSNRKLSLASEAKNGKVKEIVEDIDQSKMIIFNATEEKRVINVFTDVDCHFCRKLHGELGTLVDAGVTVRYIAFPAFSRDIPKHVSVWCADNPQETMTSAKDGKAVIIKSCEAPVEETLNIGLSLGFRGTPQIVYDTGQIVGGYRSAERIINDLGLGG